MIRVVQLIAGILLATIICGFLFTYWAKPYWWL